MKHPPQRPMAALWLLFALFAMIAVQYPSSAATSALFGRERLFGLNASDTAAIKSTYSTVILFVVDVESNGDLNYNGNHLIVQNGTYIGDSGWGARLAALKTAPSTVKRIEVCTGGAGAPSFVNIRNLINAQGIGPSSILYRNFQALQNALGIDAIDYDDEVDYNAGAAVQFGNLIASLGMRVTLCPYNNQSYWQTVKSQLGNQVDAIYLQCYDGGAGNNPTDWNNLFGGFKVQPGDWDVDSLSTFQSKMAGWAANSGVTGGFFWLLDDVSSATTAQYGAAINNGIGGPLPIPYFMIVNQNSGKCVDLIGGNTANGAVTNQWSYDYNGPNQRWGLVPTENGDHFKIVSWVDGKVISVSNNSTTAGAQLWAWDYSSNEPSQQWDLVDAGSGWFWIRNVRSGLYMDVSSSSTADNAKVQQWTLNKSPAQTWRVQPWGNYMIRAAGGRYICVQGASGLNGAYIIQYDWQPNPWFVWQFVGEGAGYYGVFTQNATNRVICVDQGSTAAGANTHLWDYNTSNVGDQKVRILPKTNGKYKFYFAHTNYSWDMPGGATGNNVNLQQYPDNGYPWQDFLLERQ